MRDFAAIDFETANMEPSSVCSVGLVVVRGGEVVDRFYSLIRPEPEYYCYWNTRVQFRRALSAGGVPYLQYGLSGLHIPVYLHCLQARIRAGTA